MTVIAVTGSFDDLRSHHVRFLQEASKLGNVHVLLWSDEVAHVIDGSAPRFPQDERLYTVRAIRYVDRVTLVTQPFERDALPPMGDLQSALWMVDEAGDSPYKRAYCREHSLDYAVLSEIDLQGFPITEPALPQNSEASSRKKSSSQGVSTGCIPGTSVFLKKRPSWAISTWAWGMTQTSNY